MKSFDTKIQTRFFLNDYGLCSQEINGAGQCWRQGFFASLRFSDFVHRLSLAGDLGGWFRGPRTVYYKTKKNTLVYEEGPAGGDRLIGEPCRGVSKRRWLYGARMWRPFAMVAVICLSLLPDTSAHL